MTCHFCGRARPVDPIPRGAFTIDGSPVDACSACWSVHDDEDDRRTLEAGVLAFAPEELEVEYLRTATRLPPRRAAILPSTLGRPARSAA